MKPIPEDEVLPPSVPKDRFNVAYMIFFLQGVGVLFPWNAFITSTSYFQDRLKHSSFEESFENFISLTSQTATLSFLALATRYQHRLTLGTRVYYPLYVMAAAFSLNLMLVEVHLPENLFFGVTLIICFVSSAASSILQGGIFGLASRLPPRYVQAVVAGMGLGGVIVSALNVVALASFSGVSRAAILFFAISIFVVVLCIVTFRVAFSLPICEYYLSERPPPAFSSGQRSLSSPPGSRPTSPRASITPLPDANLNDVFLSSDGDAESLLSPSKLDPAVNISIKKKNLSRHRSYLQTSSTLKATFLKIREYVVIIFLNFLVTLSVFPNIASNIDSGGNSHYDTKFFIPVVCFLLYNFADFNGRWLVAYINVPSLNRAYLLKYLIVLRVVLIPLFLVLPMNFPSSADHMPVVLTSPVWPYALLYVLGLTNGYFSSLCMIYSTSMVEPEEQEAAGTMMVFSLNVGIALGILISFPLKLLLCHCDPLS